VLDGSAELGFANLEDQAIFAEAGTILYGDEANFIGQAVAYALPNGSLTYVDREEDGARNGPDRFHRVHVYMNRKPGPEASGWLAKTSAELARCEAVQKWKLHLPEPYSNEHPAPPSPNVEHIVENDRLNLAIAEVAFTSARAAREFFATLAFQKVLGGQAEHIDALGAYLVTGFYTFVRDGRPTTAGLRGSRPPSSSRQPAPRTRPSPPWSPCSREMAEAVELRRRTRGAPDRCEAAAGRRRSNQGAPLSPPLAAGEIVTTGTVTRALRSPRARSGPRNLREFR
jgi:hypothetical protein